MPTRLVAIATLAVLCTATPTSSNRLKEWVLTVEAGQSARRETLISLPMPALTKGTSLAFADSTGKSHIIQVDDNGVGWLVIPTIDANTKHSFKLVEKTTTTAGVTASKEDQIVRISRSEQPVLSYIGGKGTLPTDVDPVFRRGGYIHPVYTPSGRVVSDDYPPDHRHHHGIWFAWTRTEFESGKPDFWNMGQKIGTVEFDSLDQVWSGPIHGGLRATHRYIDLTTGAPKPVLKESWQIRAFAVGRQAPRYMLFDIDVRQDNVTRSRLILPEYHYGGLGFRGAREWQGAEGAVFLSSEGKDRSNGHATRARWCYVGGRVGGNLAGIAILSHPGNFRAPQPMRIHPTEPFFCFAPSQLGQWDIPPDAPYLSRYRFVAFDGAPDIKEIERLWSDYADPPRATIK